MNTFGIQLAPRAGSDVVYGLDSTDPARFVIRGSYLRPRLLAGLAILFFAGGSQLEALRSGNPWSLAGATIVACLASAAAFVRRRLVLDRARAEVLEEFAIAAPFARRVRELSSFRHVVVSRENRPAAHGRETVYPVDLQAALTRIRVCAMDRWELAVPLSEALARFLDLPLRDARRGGNVAVDHLDAPLRDDPPRPFAAAPPQPSSCRVTVDREALLKVEIPRPAVAQTLFLNAILLAFCVLPLVLEVALPMWRGWRPESARETFFSVGWLLLPAILVSGGSIRHVARNGGSLSVTPEAVRFRRHGVIRSAEVTIPSDAIEDLVILEPEMGGSRNLFAYLSSGVLVVRSDDLSFRAGYGLSIPELEWLRDRIREVIGQAGRRAPSAVASVRTAKLPGAAVPPLYPRWSRVGLGMLGGGLFGQWIGGTFGVCVALPYLEHLLNFGTMVGGFSAAALTPSLRGQQGPRRILGAIAAGLVVIATASLMGRTDFIQSAPREALGTSLSGAFTAAAQAGGWDADRERFGFFPIGVLGNALLVNGFLLIAFQARASDWRPDPASLFPQSLRLAPRVEGLLPPQTVVALVATAALAGLSLPFWLGLSERGAEPMPIASRPPHPQNPDRANREQISEPPLGPSTRPTGESAISPSPSAGSSSRSAPLPDVPPVVPNIETPADLDSVLAPLTGRPVLLLYWSGDEPREWLPDADRLHRIFAAHGLEVIGVPRSQDEALVRQVLGAARIGWGQIMGASAWRSRIPTVWPQIVLLDAAGEIVYRGQPGPKVDEALERLVEPPSRPPVEPQGIIEGRLVYAGRLLHETITSGVRFWFRNEWTGREAQLQTAADPRTSEFRFAGPIGTYLVSVFSGPRLDHPPHASWNGSSTFAVTAGDPRRQDISLQRMVRLREPVDNGKTLPPLPQRFVHASPVRFAWDSVPEANVYRYRLFRDGDRSDDPLAGETTANSFEITLSPGAYQLQLSAHGPSGLVGRLETYGANYRAWTYSFTVR